MTREELIEFAKYLDEGCNLLGEGYIESRTDEYLQKVANKNFALADVSGECLHPYNAVRKDKITELCSCSICKKGWY